MLTHGNILASVEAADHVIAPQEHRVVSLLPLSHLLEQVTALYYALTVGADILYVRSRNPRVIFEAIRDHRVTTMVVVPQVLDLFWSAIEREVAKTGRTKAFERLRRIARRLPYRLRRILFRRVHRQLGGKLNLFVCAGAFLPPSLQQAWEDLGVVVMQGYGATECGPASVTTKQDHGLGTVGKPIRGLRGEALPGERDPDARPVAVPGLLARRGGDEGGADGGRLVPHRGHRAVRRDRAPDPDGPHEGHHRAAQRAQRVSRGHRERAPDRGPARLGGRRDAARADRGGRARAGLAQPAPGRGYPGAGEAEADADGAGGLTPDETRRLVGAAVKQANATLAAHQRVEGWRIWPESDFPRTHTLKVKRDEVRRWAVVDAPLPVQEERAPVAV